MPLSQKFDALVFILILFCFKLKSDKIELAVQLESSKLETAEVAQCKERQAAQFGLQEKEYFGEIENLKDRLAELPRGFEEEKKTLEEYWRLKFVRTIKFFMTFFLETNELNQKTCPLFKLHVVSASWLQINF